MNPVPETLSAPALEAALVAIERELDRARAVVRDAEARLADLLLQKEQLLAQNPERGSRSFDLQSAILNPQSSEARESLHRELVARAIAAGLGDPATCHNLGLFALAETHRHLQHGDFAAALLWAERAVAHLAVPLTDPDYLLHFVRQRGVVYDRNLGPEEVATLETEAVRRVTEVFQDLAVRGEALQDAGQARQAADLPLIWRVELRVARLLRQPGRLSAAWH